MPCVKLCRLLHDVQFYKCNGQCHHLLPKSKQKQQYLQVQTLIFWENQSFIYIYILIMPKSFSRTLYHVTMVKQNAASVILSCCDLPWYHFHSSEKYTTWTVGKFTFLYKSLCHGTQIKKKPISDNFQQTCSRLKSDIPFNSRTEAHNVLMHNIVVL